MKNDEAKEAREDKKNEKQERENKINGNQNKYMGSVLETWWELTGRKHGSEDNF